MNDREYSPLDLDPIIHERARLGIMSALVAAGKLTFSELKGILNLTDGNLSVHAGHLIKAGYIAQNKKFVRNKPRTTYSITKSGRAEFDKYLAAFKSIIDAAEDNTGREGTVRA